MCSDGDDPEPDVCDGIDNDCDPATRDGSAEPTLGHACDGPDADLCAEGMYACVDGEKICSDASDASPDVCDGVDNDCDAATEDGSAEAWFGMDCDGDDADLCVEGTSTCADGEQVCSDANDADPDMCDGLDNDCDPATPDGSAEPALGRACDGPDEDLCRIGSLECNAGVLICAGDGPYDGCNRGCYAGSGTIAEPYVIELNEQVDRMYWCLNRHFALDTDIDLAGTCPRATRDYSGSGGLTGSVDGRGHTISRLSCVDDSEHRGFLPFVGDMGRVENTHFVDAEIVACRFAGVVAGDSRGLIRNVTATGIVQIGGPGCQSYAGGIAGHNGGTIESCQTDVVVGQRDPSATVGAVGGIAGASGLESPALSVVRGCSATGAVSGNAVVGGVVGYNAGVVERSSAIGTVSGGSYVGGIVGSMERDSGARVRDCYFEGTVAGTGRFVGGIAGTSVWPIENVWVSGNVSGLWPSGAVAGAIAFDGTITNAFYDSTIGLGCGSSPAAEVR